MNELMIKDFEGKTIRTKIDEDGNPWWVAKDVCEALGLKSPQSSYRRIDNDDRADVLIEHDGQRREMTVVNESGLYALIFQSETDAAKRFKKWITSEVLPSIRKTGSYSIVKKDMDPIAQFEAHLSFMKEQRAAMIEFNKKMEEVAITARQDNDTLTHDQISELDAIIHTQYKKHKNGVVAGLIKKKIKEEFFEIRSTRTYKEIPRSGFKRACEIAEQFTPPLYLTQKKS
jgi:prophage antirepressor-like protein